MSGDLVFTAVLALLTFLGGAAVALSVVIALFEWHNTRELRRLLALAALREPDDTA